MLPKLSVNEITEKVNKVGFSFYPDILPNAVKCKETLTALYDSYPDLFQNVKEIGPNVFAFSRMRSSAPSPEHSLVLTPKGGTLTFSEEAFQHDNIIAEVSVFALDVLKDMFPVRRMQRVGRIVEIIHRWPTSPRPHDWLRENFTVFAQPEDDVQEIHFRLLHRTSGMNVNTFFNPVRHRKTGDWGLQVICDINNIDTSGNIDSDGVCSIIDFSTLYFPDRTFEFLNRHVKE